MWTGRMAQADGVWHEKGVDVKIAADMVPLAYRDLYDAAILVSGDGDLAPFPTVSTTYHSYLD